MKNLPAILTSLLLIILNNGILFAQNAGLGVQGILKKANGNAVDDGQYSITFKLYDVASGGTALWTETQSSVEVSSGIYTAQLGSVTSLGSLSFSVPYFLGITVGASTEMQPRTQLTMAPYALSLIGVNNQFPSSGRVKADEAVIAGKLAVGQTNVHATQSVQVNGGILARGGAPGTNGTSNNGYAFAGNSGDIDSGLFSSADGQVSLHANGTERLQANASGVQVTGGLALSGNLTSTTSTLTVDDDLKLTTGKSLQYNTLSDWRLVDRDDFAGTSLDNWQCTVSLTGTDGTTNAPMENISYGAFNGNVIRPLSNDHFLKKGFDLSGVGSFTYVKIVFKYYQTDSWDLSDLAVGGFATSLGGDPTVCWQTSTKVYSNDGIGDYIGGSSYTDAAVSGQMIASNPGNNFFVFFGMVNDDSTSDERFALSNIEVWVR